MKRKNAMMLSAVISAGLVLMFVFSAVNKAKRGVTIDDVMEYAKANSNIATHVGFQIAPTDATSPEKNDYTKNKNKVYKSRVSGKQSPVLTDYEIDYAFPPQTPEGRHRKEYAKRYGAKGKITLKVVDSNGSIVPDAKVHTWFWTGSNTPQTDGYTDDKGLIELEGKTMGYFYFTVDKEGYYQTYWRYWFVRMFNDCVEDGRWLPWNPVLEVVLKEIRNPIQLAKKTFGSYIPKDVGVIGFDCFENDWVAPHGAGKIADLLFSFTTTGGWEGRRSRHYTNELVISTGSVDGIFVEAYDMWSLLKSSHEAPESGYQQHVRLSKTVTTPYAYGDKIDDVFINGRHIVFRSRVKMDDNGIVVSANYGKIYPDFSYGDAPPEKGEAGVRFTYYFNPTPNDRNIESDGLR